MNRERRRERENGRSAVILRKLHLGNVLHQTVDASRRSWNLGKRRFWFSETFAASVGTVLKRWNVRGGDGNILRRLPVCLFFFLRQKLCVLRAYFPRWGVFTVSPLHNKDNLDLTLCLRPRARIQGTKKRWPDKTPVWIFWQLFCKSYSTSLVLFSSYFFSYSFALNCRYS